MLQDFDKKSVSVESIAKKVTNDTKLLDDLLNYTSSKKAVEKYKSLKVLTLLSEEQSELLYPKWDFFVKYPVSMNGAIGLICCLTTKPMLLR